MGYKTLAMGSFLQLPTIKFLFYKKKKNLEKVFDKVTEHNDYYKK